MLFWCGKIVILPSYLPHIDKLKKTPVRSLWRVEHRNLIQMFVNPHFKYFHSFDYEITNIFFLDIISSATTAIINGYHT